MHPESAILHGALVDSDDVVHLVRVIDWLKGQDWFDPILHRLAPPEGVAIHYSRLAELPLAALVWPLHKMGLSYTAAATLVAAIGPLVLLGVFFVALRWVAEALVPRDWARFSAFPALFASPIMLQFSPGRVDHHGLSLIFMLMALGCIVRLMRDPAALKWALGGGFFLAFGQAIALETLPWLLLFSGWMGVWLTMKGKGLALPAVLFGLSLYVFSYLFLAASVSQEAFYETNLLAFSWLYVLIAGGIACALVVVALASQAPWPWFRFMAAVLSVGVFGFVFLSAFPELSAGPYGGMNKELAEIILGNINEAASFFAKASGYGDLLTYLPIPVLGLLASLWMAERARGDDVWPWTFLSLLIVAATFLVIVYQVRVAFYACLFSLVPLTAFFREGLMRARETFHGRKLAATELFLLLLVGPIVGVLLPALADGRSFNKGVLLFPVKPTADRTCFPDGLIQMLNLPSTYGDRPRLIMNSMNEGSTILFHTPHQALAAPYHTNVKGNLDSAHFFKTQNPQEAEKIVRARGAELVLMCGNLARLYRNDPESAHFGQDGSPIESAEQTFAQQLVSGKTPSWLKRVEMPFLGAALLFEVLPEKKK